MFSVPFLILFILISLSFTLPDIFADSCDAGLAPSHSTYSQIVWGIQQGDSFTWNVDVLIDGTIYETLTWDILQISSDYHSVLIQQTRALHPDIQYLIGDQPQQVTCFWKSLDSTKTITSDKPLTRQTFAVNPGIAPIYVDGILLPDIIKNIFNPPPKTFSKYNDRNYLAQYYNVNDPIYVSGTRISGDSIWMWHYVDILGIFTGHTLEKRTGSKYVKADYELIDNNVGSRSPPQVPIYDPIPTPTPQPQVKRDLDFLLADSPGGQIQVTVYLGPGNYYDGEIAHLKIIYPNGLQWETHTTQIQDPKGLLDFRFDSREWDPGNYLFELSSEKYFGKKYLNVKGTSLNIGQPTPTSELSLSSKSTETYNIDADTTPFIRISGDLDKLERGQFVMLSIKKPDGTTQNEHVLTTDKGHYSFIFKSKDWKPGTYHLEITRPWQIQKTMIYIITDSSKLKSSQLFPDTNNYKWLKSVSIDKQNYNIGDVIKVKISLHKVIPNVPSVDVNVFWPDGEKAYRKTIESISNFIEIPINIEGKLALKPGINTLVVKSHEETIRIPLIINELQSTQLIHPSFKTETFIPESRPPVPDWLKNNVQWWANGTLDDNTFKQGISYMIKEDIISIDDLPAASGATESAIPDWVKQNAKWWADGVIGEDDFINGLKYMVEKGIIGVD